MSNLLSTWLKTVFVQKAPPALNATNLNAIMTTMDEIVDILRWKSGRPYSVGDPCFYAGVPYKSLVDTNTAAQPDLNPDKWQVTGGGSSAADVGYTFDNGQFESATTGWTRYKDAAGATPVDGTGGTPTASMTITRVVATDLTGKAYGLLTKPVTTNLQGEGLSYDFGIDRGMRMKPCQVQFNYETSAPYVDGDIGVFIYDITNGNLIPCSVQALPATNGQAAFFMATFLPSANSGSYRLIFHVTVATTLAWTLKLDNVRMGSFSQAVGAVIGKTTTFVPSVNIVNLPGAWASAKYARVGDNLKLMLTYTATGPATGNLTVDINNIIAGLGISLVNTSISWLVSALKQGVGYFSGEWATNIFSPSGSVWNSVVPFTWAAGDGIFIDITVPISQWTSNVNLASDFTEYAYNTSTTTTVDTTSFGYGPDGASIQSFAPVGINTVYKYARFTRQIQPTDRVIAEICTNNGVWQSISERGFSYACNEANTEAWGIAASVVDNYTVAISFNARYGKSAGATWNGASGWRWRFRKVSNGNMAEVPPIVRAEYTNQTTSAAAASQNYANKVEDTHNAVTTGVGWKFTAPIAGVYFVEGTVTGSSGTVNDILIYKNGSLYRMLNVTSAAMRTPYSHAIRLLAGDYIQLYSGSYGFTASVNDRISITRIGS